MNDRTPTEAADLSPKLLVQRAREMADIAIRERKLGEYTAPYAGALLRAMADLIASPPAPAAEPVVWQWRFRAPNSDSPAATQWSAWADGRAPELRASAYETEERPLYTHPLDAAAIRAEARRAAMEDAGRIIRRHVRNTIDLRGAIEDIRALSGALADKGEAE